MRASVARALGPVIVGSSGSSVLSDGEAAGAAGYHRILWPTDFSTLAQAVLSHAVGLASDARAELVLLHVLPPLTTYVVADMSGTLWAPCVPPAPRDSPRGVRRLRDAARAGL
jgi:nucleotide-binding universal stress UspA family protein